VPLGDSVIPRTTIRQPRVATIGCGLRAGNDSNKVYFVGLLVAAVLLDVMSNPVAIFLLACAAVIGAAVCTGKIRARPGARQQCRGDR